MAELKCPGCGKKEFRLQCVTTVDYVDGEPISSTEWTSLEYNEESLVECAECIWSGTVGVLEACNKPRDKQKEPCCEGCLGWAIFNDKEIQKCDECAKYESDAEAGKAAFTWVEEQKRKLTQPNCDANLPASHITGRGNG